MSAATAVDFAADSVHTPVMNPRQRLPASLTPLDVALAALLRGLRPVVPGARVPSPAAEGTGPELPAWPPHDVAAVDGWALRASDLVGASSYTPVPLIKAPVWVEAGDRIPDGCDCIIDEDAVDLTGPIAQALGEAIPGQGIRRKSGAIADARRIVNAWQTSRFERRPRLRVEVRPASFSASLTSAREACQAGARPLMIPVNNTTRIVKPSTRASMAMRSVRGI